MKKKTLKVGVATLAVTAMLASTSVMDVFAYKSTQNINIEWKSTSIQRMIEQLEVIKNKHKSNQSPLLVTKDFKVIFKSAFAITEKDLKPITITKPVVTPEVKPAQPKPVTPEVKPNPKPVTPEIKPEQPKPVTPEIKPEQPKPVIPEIKPEQPKPVTPEDKPEQEIDNKDFSVEQQQVLALVNKERAAVGLNPLTLDAAVSKVATEKARDMQDNNYFSHQSPTYGSPFNMLTQFGVKYAHAGENIAYGQRNAEEVMTAWMNSPGHRQNILSANFTKIGVGYVGNKWVQLFIG